MSENKNSEVAKITPQEVARDNFIVNNLQEISKLSIPLDIDQALRKRSRD